MVGEILRSEREKQGYTLADVAEETSIRETYLAAIEMGNYDELPGDVYAKGFIRNYSRFLKIDGTPLLAQYDSERNIEKQVQPADMPKNEPKAEAPKAEKKVELPKKTNFSTSNSYGNLMNQDKGSGLKKVFLGLVGIAVLALGGIYVAFMDDGSVEEKPVVQQQEVVQEKKAPEKVYDGVEITAKMLDNSWISVSVDGQYAYEGTVEKGKDMTFNGKESVEIYTGNAGSVQITFNGKDAGTLGEVGQIADRTFTKETTAAPADEAQAQSVSEPEPEYNSGYQESSYSYSEPAQTTSAPAEIAEPEPVVEETPAPAEAPAEEVSEPAPAAETAAPEPVAEG